MKVKGKIMEFMTEHEEDLEEIRLTALDWDFLDKAHTFLENFSSANLWAEDKRSSISQAIEAMDTVLLSCEEEKEKYLKPNSYDPRILHSIEIGWFLIEKYYQKLYEAPPVYVTAVMPDPAQRAAYIKQNTSSRIDHLRGTAAVLIWAKLSLKRTTRLLSCHTLCLLRNLLTHHKTS